MGVGVRVGQLGYLSLGLGSQGLVVKPKIQKSEHPPPGNEGRVWGEVCRLDLAGAAVGSSFLKKSAVHCFEESFSQAPHHLPPSQKPFKGQLYIRATTLRVQGPNSGGTQKVY